MDQDGCLRLLEEALKLSPNTLNPAQKLSEVKGWDSLAVVEVMAAVDERLGATLDLEKIAACKTVADLVKVILTAS